MRVLTAVLLVTVGLFVAIAMATCLFVAAGYVVSLAFGLSLFQAALLAVGASLVVLFALTILVLGRNVHVYVRPSGSYDSNDEFDEEDEEDFDEDDEEDDEEDNEEDDEDSEGASGQQRLLTKSETLPRNARCSCGSGLKYKHCCGKWGGLTKREGRH